MSLKVLIIPDKFKGTLTAQEAAAAMARGWRKARPGDGVELLPMSDGGDGFGAVMSELLRARVHTVKTVDAAHRPCRARWWWEAKTKTAIIESAGVIGLAQLPPGKFHPFQLDTFGLGAVIRAAAAKGTRCCLIGIGGSATNDGGFGMARALGWKFLDRGGNEIQRWTELESLAEMRAPEEKILRHLTGAAPKREVNKSSAPVFNRAFKSGAAGGFSVAAPGDGRTPWFAEMIVAVDVQNPLLGARGCTRIYGPQKGLTPEDFPVAERQLRRLAVAAKQFGRRDYASEPGAGAAGGLGFGLRFFAGARLEPGFELFATMAKLKQRLRSADLVITGEGALDASSLMGKGVGEVARWCRQLKIPCIGLGGTVAEGSKKSFAVAHGLTELTSAENAKRRPAYWLEKLAEKVAREWR